ncbi:MAG: 2-phospho-L-lactate transferase CofD family protein [Pseudomonadota bacterium]
MLQALIDPALAALVICPSNPFVSIDPILAIGGVRELLARRRAPLVAVSPIVGGKAIKGPGAQNAARARARSERARRGAYYGKLLDGFVIDRQDAALTGDIEALAWRCSRPTRS